jgi:hypothetical protein
MSGRGRPTIYTDELAIDICEKIASGTSLRGLCAMRDEETGANIYPVASTIIRWALENPEFGKMYKLANQIKAYLLYDDCLDISDGNFVVKDEQTGEEVKVTSTERAALMIKTRQSWAAVFHRTQFGAETKNRIVGDNGDDPVNTKATVTLYLPDNERDDE